MLAFGRTSVVFSYLYRKVSTLREENKKKKKFKESKKRRKYYLKFKIQDTVSFQRKHSKCSMNFPRKLKVQEKLLKIKF